jgi:apolipoprotein N-acyltransferase
VALVPLVLALEARRSFLVGWLHGLVAWGVSLVWIVETLTTYGQLDGWLAAVSLFLLACFLGLYTAVFAWIGARFWKCGGWIALLGLPALWVVLEVARGWVFTGFPWNLAAYAWLGMPGSLQFSAWIGAWGISFLVLSVNVALALAAARRRWEIAAFALLVTAVLLALGARWADREPDGAAGEEERTAILVQPNTPNQVVFDVARFEQDYRRLLALSREACRPGALLIWPESAAWPLVHGRDPRLEADLAALAAHGCPVLFNSIRDEGERYFNAMLLRSTGGEVAAYHKRHLVPFGEYVPLKKVFRFLKRLARNAGDFSPADRLALLDWEGERFGPAICYEVVFPGETAETVRAGATALVTVTNDAWYGDTAAPWQHLAAARFRAAENRRWLLRAAITGVSAAIAPDGSLRGVLGVGEEGTIVARFEGRRDLSPFSRAPWAVPAICACVVGLSLFAAPRQRRRVASALPPAR